MGTSGAEIRALRPGDDLDAQLDLSERAFGAKTAAERDSWRQELAAVIAEGQALGTFEDGRATGGAMFFDMRQWWHGRVVPMAGVGGVKVAPEDRGKGIGRRLMTALLDEIAARGFPLSVLYPATMPIYRSLGWELAGARYSALVPGHSLRTLVPPDAAAGSSAAAPPSLRRACAGPGPPTRRPSIR